MASPRQRDVLAFSLAVVAASTSVLGAQKSAGATAPVLTLGQLLDTLLAQHPRIGAARARVRAAQGGRTTAGAFGNPIVAYEVDDTPFPGGGSLPLGLEREAMTTITLPLEGLYQRASRVRAANADVRAAEANAAVERQQVALDAANAYYQTALAQVSLAAARDLTGWLDTLVDYDRSRVREGATAEADLLRAELERDRSGAEVSRRAAELARIRADLAAFLGDSGLGPSVAVDDAPLALPVLDEIAGHYGAPPAPLPHDGATVAAMPGPFDTIQASALNIAFANRAELRAAHERATAAAAVVATERGMLIRQLGVTVGAKQTIGTTSLIAGVSLPLPVFDQNRGEVARASAERDAATLELAATRRSVRAEVVGAVQAAHLLTEQATVLARPGREGFLMRADEARRIALGAYREGAVPLLQVLDAARAWSDARVAYYQILFAQHESVLSLLASEGVDLFTYVPDVVPTSAGGASR